MDDSDDETSGNVFLPYQPQSRLGSVSHPTKLCESTSLGYVSSPVIKYDVNLSPLARKSISNVQLETVLLACQKHTEFHRSGSRAGFFIGDGTGVGKGRMIAAIIMHNFEQGRKKAVWISASPLLRVEAEKDLNALGYTGKALNIDDLSLQQEGLVFMTYTSLGSAGSTQKKLKKKTSRYQQLVFWLGHNFDGLIAFDECHKAKKYSTNSQESTRTGKCVVALQEQYPNARILYSSATAAWEPEHLIYLQRLGLWDNSIFYNAETFIKVMANRQVEAMEVLAMELKYGGYYVARQLSMEGLTFECQTVELTNDFRKLYDNSAKIWRLLIRHLSVADTTSSRRIEISNLWGSIQRYFRALCTSAKVLNLIQLVQSARSEDKAVVIGIQSTGEEAYKRYCRNLRKKSGAFSLCREILRDAIESNKISLEDRNLNAENAVSAEPLTSLASKADQKTSQSDYSSSNGSDIPPRKRCLLNIMPEIVKTFWETDHLFPPNPLDSIIALLGGPDVVCEMTGRQVREIQTNTGYLSITRDRDASKKDQELFMTNKRSIIVISDSASTGISLHEDKKVGPKGRRRLHVTLELPWSADKAVQQLGRTHRANQHSAPLYMLLLSDIPAEMRFSTAVADRLKQLGAMSHGDRRVADSSHLSKFALHPQYCRETLMNMLWFMCGKSSVVNGYDSGQGRERIINISDQLSTAGLISDGRPTKGSYAMKKFLNKMFLLDIDLQETVMELFDKTFQHFVSLKMFGELRSGVEDITPRINDTTHTVAMLDERVFNLECGPVSIHVLQFDYAITWAEVIRLTRNAQSDNSIFFKQQFGRKSGIKLGIRTGLGWKVFKPATGMSASRELLSDMRRSGIVVSMAEAQQLWKTERMEYGSVNCIHQYRDGKCTIKQCRTGCRFLKVVVVSGCLMQIWEQIFEANGEVSSIVRCSISKTKKVIGVRVDASKFEDLVLYMKQKETKSKPTKSDDNEITTLKPFVKPKDAQIKLSDSSDSDE